MENNNQNQSQPWTNSICIPTLYKSISKHELLAFMEDKLGKVSRIDFVNLNENSRRVFVHFSEWYSDKGFGPMARYQMEKFGFCNISIPNEKNKKKQNFDAKILINKNPLSTIEFKVKQLKYRSNISFQRHHNTETKFNILEINYSILEKKIEKIEHFLNLDREINHDDNYNYNHENNGIW